MAGRRVRHPYQLHDAEGQRTGKRTTPQRVDAHGADENPDGRGRYVTADGIARLRKREMSTADDQSHAGRQRRNRPGLAGQRRERGHDAERDETHDRLDGNNEESLPGRH